MRVQHDQEIQIICGASSAGQGNHISSFSHCMSIPVQSHLLFDFSICSLSNIAIQYAAGSLWGFIFNVSSFNLTAGGPRTGCSCGCTKQEQFRLGSPSTAIRVYDERSQTNVRLFVS